MKLSFLPFGLLESTKRALTIDEYSQIPVMGSHTPEDQRRGPDGAQQAIDICKALLTMFEKPPLTRLLRPSILQSLLFRLPYLKAHSKDKTKMATAMATIIAKKEVT